MFAAAGCCLFAGLIIVLRHAVLPNIDAYRPRLEQLLSESLALPVRIGAVNAYWVGLHPALSLRELEIRDREGRPALQLQQVEAELAWESLPLMSLRLRNLEIVAPDLVLRRDGAGRLFVAGLEIDTTPADEDGLGDWLLEQHRVVIRDARLRWEDDLRQAPPLQLDDVDLQMENRFGRHRIGLGATPPANLASRIDVRGDFRGRDIDALQTWKGQAYLDITRVDLAAWRAWVDYPFGLRQGRGGLRLWLDFARRELTGATADIALADVALTLREDLAELQLAAAGGRLTMERGATGTLLKARGLEITDPAGARFAPGDVDLQWQDTAADARRVSLAADSLDLGAVARLASHLPLPADLQARLTRLRPSGVLEGLTLSGQSANNVVQSWSIKSRFRQLGLQADGTVPGATGISGRVQGDQQGGTIDIAATQASVDLPAIFPEPRIALDRLQGQVAWRPRAEGMEFSFQQLAFENADAAGDVSGRWHPSNANPKGPGVLDLSGRLVRGRGESAWRYLPFVVGKDAREWIRYAVRSGSASDVSFQIAGDLWHFPFAIGSDGRAEGGGRFKVHGRFRDAQLRYAEQWPEITGIEGELLFENARMLISASRGRLSGAELSQTQAEIRDLLAPAELLDVRGIARGDTADFLRFIDASPVGERIDRFTEDMRAEGSGELDLRLMLPLRRMEQSRVQGSYRFDSNRLTVDPDLPPLGDVQGQLRFTERALESRGLRATLAGGPMQIDIRTAGDGNVQVNAGGELSMAGLRRQWGSPLFDHLAGSTRWSGTVRVRKKVAEVSISSNLTGISSSLPPPFNKAATDALAFRFERRPQAPAKVDAGRTALPAVAADQVSLSLDKGVRAVIQRRHEGNTSRIVAGTVALGSATPPAMPERGLRVTGQLPEVDLDFWRRIFSGQDAPETGHSALATLPATEFDLRADALKLFDKRFPAVRLSGQQQGSTIRADFRSTALNGNLQWDRAGKGRLRARLNRIEIPESLAAASPEQLHEEVGRLVDSLPAVDIGIDHLLYKGRELGAVTMTGENADGYWNARLALDGDETQLKGTLKWRPDPARSETRVDIDLDSRSIEKLLGRAGYGDAIRRGTAKLAGQLHWRGSPLAIDYPSLAGTLSVDAADGQFTKLEPGVGRLLGVLSLQSLPRRITLDFRDIFSEGFAFDRIRGRFEVAQGIMQTTGFQIQGPSAKVLMNGSIDLGRETQNLHVRVQPAVGETLAVGAMIAANPVAGAVAWAAQKILRDPLDQVFAFEYQITGQWQDPKVDKVGQTTPPAAPASEEKP